MDDKYLELRIKLDWTRLQTERVLKRKDKAVCELRSRFVLVRQLSAGTGKHKVPPPLLDDYDIDHQIDSSKLPKSQSKKTASPIGPTKKTATQSTIAKSVRFSDDVLPKDNTQKRMLSS
jgi:hypothetical protein